MTTNIAVSETVWTELNGRKRPGESFDDVLRRVLDVEPDDGTEADDTADSVDLVGRVVAACDHGRTDAERKANHAIVRTATEWLRAQDSAIQKGDAPLDEWAAADTYPGEKRSGGTIWDEVITPTWKAAAAVTKPTYRSYRWVGE